jgi:hypothetical protein
MHLHWSLKVTTPPIVPPADLQAMKLYLRVDSNFEDQTIQDLICAAGAYAEAETGRTALQTTYRMMLDRFPLTPGLEYIAGMPALPVPPVTNRWPLDPSAWAIFIPRAPLVSVASLQYLDPSGTLQTWASDQYNVDSDSEPGRITATIGTSWPAVQFGPGAVQIAFTAGYASSQALPSSFNQAIRMLVAHWYANREATNPLAQRDVPMGVDALLGHARVEWEW